MCDQIVRLYLYIATNISLPASHTAFRSTEGVEFVGLVDSMKTIHASN